ncbi:hypothetical protein Bbelb_202410 [Branchiostoma belcheri]|nr:hypothetical protein Bbelb_202410 [Branchiostoma belcheri]
MSPRKVCLSPPDGNPVEAYREHSRGNPACSPGETGGYQQTITTLSLPCVDMRTINTKNAGLNTTAMLERFRAKKAVRRNSAPAFIPVCAVCRQLTFGTLHGFGNPTQPAHKSIGRSQVGNRHKLCRGNGFAAEGLCRGETKSPAAKPSPRHNLCRSQKKITPPQKSAKEAKQKQCFLSLVIDTRVDVIKAIAWTNLCKHAKVSIHPDHVSGPDAKRAAEDYFIWTMEECGMQVLMDFSSLRMESVQLNWKVCNDQNCQSLSHPNCAFSPPNPLTMPRALDTGAAVTQIPGLVGMPPTPPPPSFQPPHTTAP